MFNIGIIDSAPSLPQVPGIPVFSTGVSSKDYNEGSIQITLTGVNGNATWTRFWWEDSDGLTGSSSSSSLFISRPIGSNIQIRCRLQNAAGYGTWSGWSTVSTVPAPVINTTAINVVCQKAGADGRIFIDKYTSNYIRVQSGSGAYAYYQIYDSSTTDAYTNTIMLVFDNGGATVASQWVGGESIPSITMTKVGVTFSGQLAIQFRRKDTNTEVARKYINITV